MMEFAGKLAWCVYVVCCVLCCVWYVGVRCARYAACAVYAVCGGCLVCVRAVCAGVVYVCGAYVVSM